MGGIVGILGFRDEQNVRVTLGRMIDAVAHRGPDGFGIWDSDKRFVDLGHARLAMTDPSREANQPMVSNDKRLVIIFDGEIINHKELREQCLLKGSNFRSQSDTEVILESYRLWGTEAFKRFKGMWAFAIYDIEEDRIILCRDPLGIKPLYYGRLDKALYFASEPKALRAANGKFCDIDENTVQIFETTGYIDRGNWTFFEMIKRFPAANFAVVDLDKEEYTFRFKRYWTPPSETLKIKYRDAVDELYRLLRNSIELNVRCNRPFAAYLSGGLNSSAIVAIGQNLMPEGAALNTFTIRYPEFKEADNQQWPQMVINHTASSLTYSEPTFKSFLTDFNRLLIAQDEPFDNLDIYSGYHLFKTISKAGTRVILDDLGAEEQFAGHHLVFDSFLDYLLRTRRIISYIREGINLKKHHNYSLQSHLNMRLEKLKKRILAPFKKKGQQSGLSENADRSELETRLSKLLTPKGDFEKLLADLITKTGLPQVLRYSDRNSMAHSVELRHPYLDMKLINFALSLPPEYKITKGITKAILREALFGILPDEILRQDYKQDFSLQNRDFLNRAFDIEIKVSQDIKWRRFIISKWREACKGA